MERIVSPIAGEPLRCLRCDRDALTVDEAGTGLCARHATIFLTVARIDAERRGTAEALERPELTPA